MKKLLLSVVLASFAVAVQAGDDGACSSCCSAKKTSVEAKGECPMSKQAKANTSKADKSLVKQVSLKQPLKSPKATS
jgi:hypothetical protein